jgi:hypothetical protein
MHLYFYRYCARYQTRQIEEDKQALGLVINTVARGMVSDPAEYRTSRGIAFPHPEVYFFLL